MDNKDEEVTWNSLIQPLLSCQISLLPLLERQTEVIQQTLETVGDDAQLANVDLQNMLQKQQQTPQLMSNISKMLHDTAMAIIRKVS